MLVPVTSVVHVVPAKQAKSGIGVKASRIPRNERTGTGGAQRFSICVHGFSLGVAAKCSTFGRPVSRRERMEVRIPQVPHISRLLQSNNAQTLPSSFLSSPCTCRNIQQVVRETFKSFNDVVKAQGEAIRSLEQQASQGGHPTSLCATFHPSSSVSLVRLKHTHARSLSLSLSLSLS